MAEDTVSHMGAMAWLLPDPTAKPPKENVVSACKRCHADHTVTIARVTQHHIKVTPATEDQVETDLGTLVGIVIEKGHTHLKRAGTKRALLGGGGSFWGNLKAQPWDPHFMCGGGAWTLKAAADKWAFLKDWLVVTSNNPCGEKLQFCLAR
ncbi:Phosphoglycerate kinase [Durusdinium trenchii]|uniref:Phosphoglycerate kinase n=1 Tax=Durusdinium trenchii TaxID=1381693 RepID=A0ABP0HST0_9DINO